jgi:hypothetical protein
MVRPSSRRAYGIPKEAVTGLRTSFSVILDLGLSENFVSEVAGELGRSAQVYPPTAKQGREIALHGRQVEESRVAVGSELDEQIEIAIGPSRSADP